MLMEWMDNNHPLPGAIICEDWRTRPTEESRHAGTWSEQVEARIIGIIMHKAWSDGIEFVLQQPSIKPIGYANAGLKYTPGKKGAHMQDAIAHGSYWYLNKYLKRMGRVPKN